MSAPVRFRGLLAGLALLGICGIAQADFIDEHVNGFYYEPDVPDPGARRGLGVHAIRVGPEYYILFVAYYAFDPVTGAPVWVQGAVGVQSGDFSAEVNLEYVEGGSFGAEVGTPMTTDPNWGIGRITFNKCNSVTWEVTSTNVAHFSNEMGSVLSLTGNIPNSDCVYQHEFTGCPDFATPGAGDRTCVIAGGEYTDDMTLTNDTIWFLNGAVYFGARANANNTNTLYIEPGTRIIGADGNSILGIQRGAKIMAEGTADAPIVFTGPCRMSEQSDFCPDGGQPTQWGGLTINGKATINTCDNLGECTSEGEGQSGTYGGDDDDDSSGVLRYVRVSNAGFRFLDTNELNGIAFQGVGRGTVVDYVQVHNNEDDCMEFFGGTVNVRHVVLTNCRDDSFDWTEGWRGLAQYVLVRQDPDFNAVGVADHGIEADNLEGNNDNTPRAQPRIANATFIGRPDTTGILFRRGTGANVTNSIFTGFQNCLDIDDASTFTNAGTPNNLTGNLTIENTIFNCDNNFVAMPGDGFSVESFFTAQPGNKQQNPHLDGVWPNANAAYLRGNFIDPMKFGPYFDKVEYIGAFSGKEAPWTDGHWTVQEFGRGE